MQRCLIAALLQVPCPSWPPMRSSFVPVLAILAISCCCQRAVHAAFIESFAPGSPDSPTAPKNHLPRLWQQLADVADGGRGPENSRGFVMVLSKDHPAAETVLLAWDKTSPADLVFFASRFDDLNDRACMATVRVLYSTDAITWSKLWEQDVREWDPKGFEAVSLTLPLGEGTVTKFAVKWTYTQAGSLNCYRISLDDISFPAEAPSAARPAPHSPAPSQPCPQVLPLRPSQPPSTPPAPGLQPTVAWQASLGR